MNRFEYPAKLKYQCDNIQHFGHNSQKRPHLPDYLGRLRSAVSNDSCAVSNPERYLEFCEHTQCFFAIIPHRSGKGVGDYNQNVHKNHELVLLYNHTTMDVDSLSSFVKDIEDDQIFM